MLNLKKLEEKYQKIREQVLYCSKKAREYRKTFVQDVAQREIEVLKEDYSEIVEKQIESVNQSIDEELEKLMPKPENYDWQKRSYFYQKYQKESNLDFSTEYKRGIETGNPERAIEAKIRALRQDDSKREPFIQKLIENLSEEERKKIFDKAFLGEVRVIFQQIGTAAKASIEQEIELSPRLGGLIGDQKQKNPFWGLTEQVSQKLPAAAREHVLRVDD